MYAVVAVLWRPPGWITAAYAGMSLLAFMAYAVDKAAAFWATVMPNATGLVLLCSPGWRNYAAT